MTRLGQRRKRGHISPITTNKNNAMNQSENMLRYRFIVRENILGAQKDVTSSAQKNL